MQVQSPGLEDSLEKEMAIHSSIFAWETSRTTGAWQAIAHEVAELDVTDHTQDAHRMPAFFSLRLEESFDAI